MKGIIPSSHFSILFSLSAVSVPMGLVPMGLVPMGLVPMGLVPMGLVPMGLVPMGFVPMGLVSMGLFPWDFLCKFLLFFLVLCPF
ncbi:hypothetical protein BJV78DRAFT_1139156 [Lactifluus subvellereus]|nr:hypothetical protein BJV78DRAFT_1139156 [Lactifluus subvellereus]